MLYLSLFLFIVFLVLFALVTCSEINEQIADLCSSGSESLHVWRYTFLIDAIRISSSLKQELTHLVMIAFDGIVDGSLFVVVDKVWVGS